ncbi:MAG: hypothetical protein ACI8RZ_002933 [Myxococcota bacterium]|jgi:hypothetical protein
MKKLLLTILGPFFLVGATTVGIIWWDRGAPPGFRPSVTDVTVEEINRNHRGVRIAGTAHHEFRIKQGEYNLFPLMAPSDTLGREIRVMVRTSKEIDRLVGYEDMTVEGLCRPPGNMISHSIAEALIERGYHFADLFVLIEEFED